LVVAFEVDRSFAALEVDTLVGAFGVDTWLAALEEGTEAAAFEEHTSAAPDNLAEVAVATYLLVVVGAAVPANTVDLAQIGLADQVRVD
jgi:hypothetical protein